MFLFWIKSIALFDYLTGLYYNKNINQTEFMYKKAVDFIKYNNLVIIIIAVIFLLGTGVFAQTEAGQAMIGAKKTQEQGEDNTLLLSADLDSMNMDYQIEKIEEDQDYYYVTYTYIDLAKQNGVWLYLMQEKTRKVSKKLKKDLGKYLAEELSEENEARVKDLKAEQAKARKTGEAKRVEVVEYTGLIGQTLDLAGRLFPGYKPVKKRVLPSPSVPPNVLASADDDIAGQADDLTDIYNNYIDKMDPDHDNLLGVLDNCPNIYNPDQLDSDNDGMGDACDIELPDSGAAEIINATGTEETASSGEEIINDGNASNTPDMAGNSTDNTDSTGADAVSTDNSDNNAASSEADNSTDNTGVNDSQTSGDNGADTIVVPDTNVEIIELPK